MKKIAVLLGFVASGCSPFIEEGSKNFRHPKNVKIKYEGGGLLLGCLAMFLCLMMILVCVLFGFSPQPVKPAKNDVLVAGVRYGACQAWCPECRSFWIDSQVL